MPSLDTLVRDFRFAARTLAKAPGFTLAAIVALALGIGATTAMLSVVNGVLLRPLAYADPERLVVILQHGTDPVSPANFVDWRAETHSFSAVGAAEYWSPNLIGVDEPEHITGLHVSASIFPMLGVRPLLGRVLSEGDDQPGAAHVAVISYGLWQRRFGGQRDVVGRAVLLDGERTTIVGVMPRSFGFAPFWATHSELWAPGHFETRTERGAQSLRVFARLRPGVTLAQARSELAAVTAHLEQQFPGTNRDITIDPLKDKVVGRVATPLLVLLFAVGLVLLIACANVAHMLLARGASRKREIGIRAALGATRARLLAQLLTESALLAVGGGVAGLALALWGIRALASAAPSSIPRAATVSVDGGALLAAVALTFATAVLFGLLPAIRATHIDLVEAFKDGDRASSEGRKRGRMRSMLVASEFALALLLLVGAGLMIRTVIALGRVDPGFDPSGVMTMTVSVTGTSEDDSTSTQSVYEQLLPRIRALPGVESASWINHLPIAGDEWGLSFNIEGRPKPKPGDSPTATYRVVFPGYFRTMRIPILRGRDVAESDRAQAPRAVVINQYMASTYWPGADPIGQRLSISGFVGYTIVGVVNNDVRDDWAGPPAAEMFVPYEQESSYRTTNGGAKSYLTLVVRAKCADGAACNAAAVALAPPVVATIRAVDRNLPISAVQTMDAVVGDATAESRFYLVLLTAFAGIAIVLASVGIFGVMSYAVARRTHEIGIRVALGAEPGELVRMIVGQGTLIALSGAAVGLGGSLLLTRLMAGLLYGVAPRDPATLGGVCGLLIGVAALASYLPARRAARVDPLTALRSD